VAKQNSLKRQRTSEKARQYNKAHKSAIATRMKKVMTAFWQKSVLLATAFAFAVPEVLPIRAMPVAMAAAHANSLCVEV